MSRSFCSSAFLHAYSASSIGPLTASSPRTAFHFWKIFLRRFTTNRFSNRFLYSFTPDFYVRGLVQWNSKDELVGGNLLLNYRYLPGSDLFLVYNQSWDTEGGLKQRSRSLQFKLAHFWNR